jgi:hypothetical protein
MTDLTIRMTPEQLAIELAAWPVDALMELIREIDERHGEWAFTAELKQYADTQLAKLHDGTPGSLW